MTSVKHTNQMVTSSDNNTLILLTLSCVHLFSVKIETKEDFIT